MAATRATRVLSVLAVTALALVPAAPAAAQPSSAPPPTAAAPDEGFATPPPLAPDYQIPVGDGNPDRTYTSSKLCVSSRPSTAPLAQKPWGQDKLRFDEIERFGVTGAGQTVAVIDTGVTPHAYLDGRLEGLGDYVIKEDRGLLDCDGHGTEVAGIIAADPKDPSIGFRGIAPAARILSIRQSSGNYEFKDPATNDRPVAAGNLITLAKAIVQAADSGATVINMSVDSCRPVAAGPIADQEKQVQAALRYAVDQKDVVVVASAGNLSENNCAEQNSPDPKNPTWLVIPPWFSEYVLSVAAMNRDGSVADFSINGPWVSVAAPGTDIISLDPANRTGLANQTLDEKNAATPIQGTSFAAPYVAGLAALVREQYPNLRAKQVMDRIKITASHPAANGGRDTRVGYGMINPISALTTFIPAEEGIPADEAIAVPFEMPPPYERNWTPMRVALIGAGGGLGLLLLTLFVVHTVRRNRRDLDDIGTRQHA